MSGRTEGPKLYRELAAWWPLLSPPAEYADEARLFRDLMLEHASGAVASVLELGSGGGNNASHLKKWFSMTLVDLSPDMVEVSRALNPECRHEVGDMRSVRLGETFDAVFIHDAICYLTTLNDLGSAMTTAFEHCRSGGVAVFAPDYTSESFGQTTDGHDVDCGGNDGPDRALRYIEWAHDPDATDHRYTVDMVYLLRRGGELVVEHDRHDAGLFSVEQWFGVISDAGFEVASPPIAVEDDGLGQVFVGVRP